MDEVEAILKSAKDLGLNLKGVSFYIPSCGVTLQQYEKAFEKTKNILNMGTKMGHNDIDLVDIGEDFPNMLHGGSTYVPSGTNHFTQTTTHVKRLLSKYLPDKHITIIGDAGSLIAENSVYIATRIIG